MSRVQFTTAPCMDGLPEEVCVRICQYVTPQDLPNLRCVSRIWKTLLDDTFNEDIWAQAYRHEWKAFMNNTTSSSIISNTSNSNAISSASMSASWSASNSNTAGNSHAAVENPQSGSSSCGGNPAGNDDHWEVSSGVSTTNDIGATNETGGGRADGRRCGRKNSAVDKSTNFSWRKVFLQRYNGNYIRWQQRQKGISSSTLMGGKRAHSGTVTCVALGKDNNQNILFSGSDDGTLIGWKLGEKYSFTRLNLDALSHMERTGEDSTRSHTRADSLSSHRDDSSHYGSQVSSPRSLNQDSPRENGPNTSGMSSGIPLPPQPSTGEGTIGPSPYLPLNVGEIQHHRQMPNWITRHSQYFGHSGPVWCVRADLPRKRLFSGGYDSTLKIWSLESGKCQDTLRLPREDAWVTAMDVMPVQDVLVSGQSDGSIRMWSLRAWQNGAADGAAVLLGQNRLLKTNVHALQIIEQETLVSSCATASHLHQWDLQTQSFTRKYESGHTDDIYCIHQDPSYFSHEFVTGGKDKVCCMWDGRKPNFPVLKLGFGLMNSNTGALLSSTTSVGSDTSTASSINTNRIKARSGSVTSTTTTHNGAIMDVKMRGCRVVTGSKDKTLKLWDVRQPGTPLLTLYGHSHAVHSVDFSDDFIVSGSVDTGLRVWTV